MTDYIPVFFSTNISEEVLEKKVPFKERAPSFLKQYVFVCISKELMKFCSNPRYFYY